MKKKQAGGRKILIGSPGVLLKSMMALIQYSIRERMQFCNLFQLFLQMTIRFIMKNDFYEYHYYVYLRKFTGIVSYVLDLSNLHHLISNSDSVGVNKLRAVFMHNSDYGFWIIFLEKVNKLPQSINKLFILIFHRCIK